MDNKMTAEQAIGPDEAFAEWCHKYGLWYEPNFSEQAEKDCRAAFLAGKEYALSAQMVPEPRKANHADYGYAVSHDKPWFFYDPEGDGMVFTATEAEARAGAEEAITDSLDDFWSEFVDQICVGRVTHSATQVDRVDRPETLNDEYTEDGEWWPEDCEFKCNYKLLPVAASPEPVVPDYESMFIHAVESIAEISVAVGVPDDEAEAANGNDEILHHIGIIKSERDDLRARIDAMPADWSHDSSLETWFPYTAQELADLRAEVEALRTAAKGMVRIVEEFDGAVKHGTWCDSNGIRLKDTPEWVALYLAARLREGGE